MTKSTDTTPAARLAALHDADADLRTAWEAFAAAASRRRQAAGALGANVGEIRLDNSWGESALLGEIGKRIATLPTRDALDLAAGNAALHRRAAEKALAEERQRHRDQAQAIREASARILVTLNRPTDDQSAARARAMQALVEDGAA